MIDLSTIEPERQLFNHLGEPVAVLLEIEQAGRPYFRVDFPPPPETADHRIRLTAVFVGEIQTHLLTETGGFMLRGAGSPDPCQPAALAQVTR